jgi:hypothetical protein
MINMKKIKGRVALPTSVLAPKWKNFHKGQGKGDEVVRGQYSNDSG